MAPRSYFFTLCFAGLLAAVVISYTLVFNDKGKSHAHQKGKPPRPQVPKGVPLVGPAEDTSADVASRKSNVPTRCYDIESDWSHQLKSPKVLKGLGCKQRKPNVLIIGARASGVRTLQKVLGFHPEVATATHEVHFFDWHYDHGLEWYREQMPFSTSKQFVIEATENYMYHRNASQRALKTLGQSLKVIVALRDPVARAISDFLLTRSRINESRHYKATFKEARMRERLLISGRGKHGRKGSTKLSCILEDTFERTVTRDGGGEVNHKNAFVADSLYVYYLRSWVKKFTSYQVLSVNTEVFARTPTESLTKIEKFLGLTPYFKPDHFWFDLDTSTFCLREPKQICAPAPMKLDNYPTVSNNTISILRKHFESSCRFLFLLLKHYLDLIGDIPLNYHPIE